jgi:hypothetical protein
MNMTLARRILLGVFGLALQGTAIAEIYESTDAEGVPEFSDTPTAGAEVVDLQKTNVADEPPDIPKAPQEEAARPAAAAPAAEDEPGYEVYDSYNNDDERDKRRLEEGRLPGNGEPGVEPRREVGEPGVDRGPAAGAHPRGHVGGHRK